VTATAQAPTNGATTSQFPNAERLLEKINEGNPRHRAMPADMAAKLELAKTLQASGLCPTVGRKDDRRPMSVEQIFVALQLGDELGLAPLQSVQGIAVVEGRPTPMYQTMLAVVQGSGKLEAYREETTEESSTVTVKRRGMADPISFSFSIADADRAGLRRNPVWGKFPRDMLRNRAGGRALKIAFADVLAGVALEDEAEDEAAVRADAKAAAWILRAEDVSALKRLMAAKKIPADDLKAIAQAATGGRQVSVGSNGVPDYSRSEWEVYEAAVRSWAPKGAPAAAPPAQQAPAAPAPVSRLADVARTYNADAARMAEAARRAGVDLAKADDAAVNAIENALTAMDQADDAAAEANG